MIRRPASQACSKEKKRRWITNSNKRCVTAGTCTLHLRQYQLREGPVAHPRSWRVTATQDAGPRSHVSSALPRRCTREERPDGRRREAPGGDVQRAGPSAVRPLTWIPAQATGRWVETLQPPTDDAPRLLRTDRARQVPSRLRERQVDPTAVLRKALLAAPGDDASEGATDERDDVTDQQADAAQRRPPRAARPPPRPAARRPPGRVRDSADPGHGAPADAATDGVAPDAATDARA